MLAYESGLDRFDPAAAFWWRWGLLLWRPDGGKRYRRSAACHCHHLHPHWKTAGVENQQVLLRDRSRSTAAQGDALLADQAFNLRTCRSGRLHPPEETTTDPVSAQRALYRSLLTFSQNSSRTGVGPPAALPGRSCPSKCSNCCHALLPHVSVSQWETVTDLVSELVIDHRPDVRYPKAGGGGFRQHYSLRH